jgi:glycosyltransferase involved in cell wall biosynthesis
MQPELSIVVPAFNEERRIGPTIEKIRSFLRTEHKRGEVIVVNDGSTDGTVATVRRDWTGSDPDVTLHVLDNPQRHGKGFAVRQGMLKAEGKQILFTDADLSSPLEEYRKLNAALQVERAGVAFGSRAIEGASIEVHQAWIREMFGRAANLLVRKVSGLPAKDTQCGFKLFTREAARAIFELQTIDGFAFDIEVLYIAKKLRIRTVEVPVTWNHVPGTRVRFATDAPRALADLMNIRYLDLRGAYTAKPRRTQLEQYATTNRSREE